MLAEKTNAELLTALKQDANLKLDVEDNDARKKKLGVKLGKEKDAGKKKILQGKIDGIDNTKKNSRRQGLIARIKALKDRLARNDARTIIVEASVAAENANMDLN